MYKLFSPSADRNDAIRHNIAPIMNDVRSEGINAFANVVGNHVVPVIVLRVDCGIVATVEAVRLDSMVLTGFAGSNAPSPSRWNIANDWG